MVYFLSFLKQLIEFRLSGIYFDLSGPPLSQIPEFPRLASIKTLILNHVVIEKERIGTVIQNGRLFNEIAISFPNISKLYINFHDYYPVYTCYLWDVDMSMFSYVQYWIIRCFHDKKNDCYKTNMSMFDL